MDPRQFDRLLMRLADQSRSRRGAVRFLAAAALGGFFAPAGVEAAAAAGCLTVGKPCRRARQCCSGICKGKRRKATCRSHGAGTCKPGEGVCQTGFKVRCNGSPACLCVETTAGAVFCADQFSDLCADCHRDADCVALGFPPDSACAPFSTGRCAGACRSEGGAVRLIPCGVELSASGLDDRLRGVSVSLGLLGRIR